MQDVLPEGGVIRKLWIGETAKYRDHMLRLDPASRRSRFGGGVSDDFIRGYVNLSCRWTRSCMVFSSAA
jgi:hypothetical protein